MIGAAVITCYTFRITEYPKLERIHKDHLVQILAPQRTTKKTHQTLCLRALSKCFLNSGSSAHAHCPLVQTLSLTPSCPSPGTAPCHSLRPCLCHREQSSALPLHSQWGSWEMGRLLKDCDQLSIQKIQRQNWKSFLIRDKDLVGTAELRNT